MSAAKRSIGAVVAVVVLASLTGCGQTFAEQKRVADECHAAGGLTYYNEAGDLKCDLADHQ